MFPAVQNMGDHSSFKNMSFTDDALLWVELCSLKKDMLKSSEGDLILGERVIAKNNQIKTSSLGQALIQYNGCPYQEGKFGCRDKHA